MSVLQDSRAAVPTVICVSIRGFLRLLFTGVVLLGVLLAAPSVSSAERSEEDPFLSSDVFPPRVLEVPGLSGDPGAGSVRLLDAGGAEIPLTGPGAVFESGVLRVYPPRLPVGEYRVVYATGEYPVTVGKPPFPSLGGGSGSSSSPILPLALLALAVPAVVLLALPRRRLLAVPLLGAAAVGGVLLMSGGSEVRPLTNGDPCALSSLVEDCGSQYVLGVFGSEGPQAAAAELRRLASMENSPWASICHEIAHDLGSRTFRLTADPLESISAGFTDCSLGYVHGVLEAMGTYLPDEAFPAAVVTACARLDELFLPEGAQSIFGCHHGVGHAAMWRFNESLADAMPVCDRFPLPRQQEECKVGAIMEWVYADQRATVSGRTQDAPLPRVDSPLELCEPPLSDLSEGCVEGALTSVARSGVEPASQWCAENPSVIEACLRSLARRVVQIDLSEGGSFLKEPMSFCGLFGDAAVQESCAMQVGYMHLFLSRSVSAAASVCEAFPVGLQSSCREGNDQVRKYAESLGDGSFNFRD